MVVLHPERGDEVGEIGRRDVVGGDATTRQEVAEVERRSVDGPTTSAGPFDLGHLQSTAFGRLGEGLGLQHPRVEGRRAVAERLAVDVERVVGRAGHARPGARGEGEPPGAGVRRGLGQQPVVGCLHAFAQQIAEAGHDTLLRVLLDEVLAHAVRHKEQHMRRVVAVVTRGDGWAGGYGQPHQQQQQRTEHTGTAQPTRLTEWSKGNDHGRSSRAMCTALARRVPTSNLDRSPRCVQRWMDRPCKK